MQIQQTYSKYIEQAAKKINMREVYSLALPIATAALKKFEAKKKTGEKVTTEFTLELAKSIVFSAKLQLAKKIARRYDDAIQNIDLDLIDRDFINILNDVNIEGSSDEAKRETRALRKQQKRDKAVLALESGVIGGRFGGFKRTTMWQIKEQVKKNKDTDRFLKSHIAVGQRGEQISLVNSFERKMAEFAIVAQGIQKVAESEGMAWAKIVVTLPPEFHINPSVGKNNWNGILPDESCKLLATEWARLRASLAKDAIKLAGCWTRETHSDGTPHINFLLYMPLGAEQQVEQKFIDYMSLGNASAKAIKYVKMDQYQFDGACGFAKYAAKGFSKYAAKNLDETEENKESLAEQSLSSAFCWRRWGFFGIPPLSQWRALRSQKDNPNATPLLDSMWRAARGNDFATFIQLNGGICAKSKQRTISTFAEPSQSGKSRIVVGIWEKSTGYYLKTKQVGYFELIRPQNQEVTLKITHPRETLSYPKNTKDNDYQRHKSGEMLH